MRRRSRNVPVGTYDPASDRWVDGNAAGTVDRAKLTLVTFNIWFNELHAEQRYQTIADLLHRDLPDVMVFQEVTPAALDVLLSQPWIRERYRRAEVTGAGVGNYGLLMLTRLPVGRVTYTGLPTRLSRGFLRAEFTINGRPVVIAAIHLESGKAASRLRARQLRMILRAMRGAETSVVLGDFNLRNAENGVIGPPYLDVWPAVRPHDDGFTEDTSINLMRYDMKSKHRHVRFDRVLLKSDSWTATEIGLLGTEPIAADLPRVFPSDHFGVRCRLVPKGSTKGFQQQRIWPTWRSFRS